MNVFGDYAGWAHNALFISQLASHKHLMEGNRGSGAKDNIAASGSGSGASSESEMTAEARAVATGANVSATPSSKSKKQKRAARKAQDPPAKLRRVRDVPV